MRVCGSTERGVEGVFAAEHRADGHERAVEGRAVFLAAAAAAQRAQSGPVQLAAGQRRHAGGDVVVEVVEQQPQPLGPLGEREGERGQESSLDTRERAQREALPPSHAGCVRVESSKETSLTSSMAASPANAHVELARYTQ